MSKPQPPAPPNPTAVGQAQTGTNIGTAVAQQTLNATNQNTPFGSTTYAPTGGAGYTDPTTGQFVPQFTQTTSLSPTQQGIFDTLTGGATTLAGQVPGAITTPLNTAGANQNIIAGGPQALDQNVTNTIFSGETALLDPILKQQQTDLQDQLSRQGISVGNTAYNNAETNLNSNQMNDYLAALGQATGTGVTAANNMYNLALQGQNQQLGQQNLVATTPLSRLSQIYGGGTAGGTPALTG